MTPTPADLRAARLDLSLSRSLDAVETALEAAGIAFSKARGADRSLAWIALDGLATLKVRLNAEVERLIPVEAARIAALRDAELEAA